MSDMVQQPVIQLVQELTMTAVVERHDCTDTKKADKSRKSPRPCLNTNNAFIIFLLFQEYITYRLAPISGQRSVNSTEPHIYRWLSQSSSDIEELRMYFL